MSDLWYKAFFGEDYWKFHEPQISAEQTALEVTYIRQTLSQNDLSQVVVDFGCGVGRHTIALAQAGYQVTGVDISAWAVSEAQRRSKKAGLDIGWQVKDILRQEISDLSHINAAISIDAFGWGSDSDQLRLLRRIRSSLAPGGFLILSLPHFPWRMRHFPWTENSANGEHGYEFRCEYDALNEHISGNLVVSSSGSLKKILPFRLRVYSTSELVSLIRKAGFAIERIDADFKIGAVPSVDARSIQICARPLEALPASLAVASWRTPADDRLELRYAPDETEWLNPTPNSIWDAVLDREGSRGAEAVGYYPVDDPYGAERAAPVVSKYFQCEISHSQLTIGPGVTSLLHDLASLADSGILLSPHLVHPDLSAWALSKGTLVHLVQEPASLQQLIAEIQAVGPSLVHLDRPNFAGKLISIEELYSVGQEAERVGALVLIDESAATYLGPAGSAVPLIRCLKNLIILRGLTKAYSWGGLRVAFAIASKEISDRVRDVVAPIQVGELSFRAALQLLAAGDIFSILRARIRTIKPRVTSLWQALGLEIIHGHPDIPWVVASDPGGATSRLLDELGIRGLQFVAPPVRGYRAPEFVLLFCPLSDERMAMLGNHLSRVLPVQEAVMLFSTPGNQA
jgi:histidinol-phosphate/aromatic aminotransferase/cobyric acid decarboxylase-like protein/ubiquinone/menaquinone biosynthesis C-methylase UbiE